MADTSAQREAEDWVTKNWLPDKYGQPFHRDRRQLSSGGVFDFDAVSQDERIIASISTSGGLTAGGKYPVGKVHKLRADMLFLLMAKAETRLIVLTESDMYTICQKEVAAGRVPKEVVFQLAEVPAHLSAKLKVARAASSDEVRPKKI